MGICQPARQLIVYNSRVPESWAEVEGPDFGNRAYGPEGTVV
jgi:hypothetical protein